MGNRLPSLPSLHDLSDSSLETGLLTLLLKFATKIKLVKLVVVRHRSTSSPKTLEPTEKSCNPAGVVERTATRSLKERDPESQG